MKYSAHYPALLRLGVPIMTGQLAVILMNIADTVMIGRHSADELAASAFVNGIIGLALVAGMGFSYGLTPVVGALMGKGETSQVAEKLKNGLAANCLLSIMLMLLLGLLAILLPHLGLPPHLIPLMRPYLLLLTLSILPQMAFNGYKQFSDGIQDTRTPMWIMLAANVANVAGNWMLIYGHGGLPELGLVGAGIATLFSRLMAWGLCFYIFHFTDHYAPHRYDFRQSCINRSDLRLLSRMGLPVMLQMGMEGASFSLSAFYVGWLGATDMAAHQTMLAVSQLCFMLYYGMAAAVAVRVSYFRGAGQVAETRRTAMAGLHLTWILGLMTAIPIFLLRQRIGIWFANDTQVAALAAALVPVLCLYQFGDAMQCIYANALRGMAVVRPMIGIAFVAYFLISLPLGYLFAFPLGLRLVGVWLAFPFGLTSAGIMYFYWFMKSTAKT